MKMNRPQLTALSLAISAALTAMAPTVSIAQTVISSDQTVQQAWIDNDFTVNSGMSITVADDSAVSANSGGTLGSFFNNGTVSGAEGGVVNNNTIVQLQNNGSILSGNYYGIANFTGSEINTLVNAGSVSGYLGGIYNRGVIDSFINDVGGVITGISNDDAGVIRDSVNKGSIGTLDNNGALATSLYFALINTGTITTLNNESTGTIDGLFNVGTVTTLNNSGAIALVQNGGSDGTYSGRGTITTLNNTGSILSSGDFGIVNDDGTIGTLLNSGSIASMVTHGIYNNHGSTISLLINDATGTISGGANGNGIFNIGLLTDVRNVGEINGFTGVSNGGSVGNPGSAIDYAGTIGTLSNSGLISGDSTSGLGIGILNTSGSTIDTLINNANGSITGTVGIGNAGTITTLSNNGEISASGALPPVLFSMGIGNSGTITSLTNGQNGVIADGQVGIANLGGTIATLKNEGMIQGSYAGIYLFDGEVTTLINKGTIKGGDAGIVNDAAQVSLGELYNSGLIQGGTNGISNTPGSALGELNNAGTIIGDTQAAISNNGSIDALNNLASGTIQNGISNNSGGFIASIDNQGTIAGSSTSPTAYALYSESAIGSLINSGLITSPVDAIYLDVGSTLGAFVNSGTVAGTITNLSAQVLTINGGSGTTFGLLTGSSGGRGSADIGLIESAGMDVVFRSGNQLLNDHINVGADNVVTNVASVLQVNNHINITGSYLQNAAATLNIGVASGALTNGDVSDLGYGRLIVSGSVVIDAGSSVMLKNVGTYKFANGQRYLVIQADSTGTNYNASTLNYGASGFNGTVSGSSIADGSNLSLLLTLDGGTQNSATTNDAQSSLNGLFKYTGTDSSLMNLFNAAAATDSSEEGNRAGSQLSPVASKSSVVGASNAVSQQVNNIAFNRLDNMSSTSGQGTRGMSSGDALRDSAVWGQAFGGRASDGGRSGIAGYHASYNGLLMGADTALNSQWRAGGLFSYAGTSVSSDGNNAGSYAKVNAYGLTAYAGFTGEPWYLNLAVGATRSNIDAHRVVSFTGFNGVANSSYNGTQYLAAAQAGYPLNADYILPGAVLTPLAGLTYSRLSQDAYTETGGNGAALHVNGTNTHSVKSDLGFKLERAYQTEQGLLKPVVQLVWRHEYSDARMQSVANFAADTSGATTFVTEGAKPVKDTGVLTLGATLLRSDNLSLSLNYHLEKGGAYTSQTGSLLARWRF